MCKMESVGESVLTGTPTQNVKVVPDGASGKKSAEYVKYTAFHPVLAISNRSLCERPFLEQIECVCKLQPDALVLREKDLSPQEYKELAEQVLKICGEHQVPCILHSFWKEALELGCNQIHLPLHLLRGLDPEAKKKVPGDRNLDPCGRRSGGGSESGRHLSDCRPHLYDGL